jgi:cytidylate kinase
MAIPGTIAIDGPAASGKSTLGKQLADQLGYLFFDTGMMYRAVTWIGLQRSLPLDKEDLVSTLAEHIEIDIRSPSLFDGRTCEILVDGEDVTWSIRRPEVDDNVSLVSSYQRVRQALTAQQRRIGLRGNVVMVGRDIGTVVMPEAEVKIYLNASVEERARRRYLETMGREGAMDYDSILAAMRARDEFDATREFAPMRPAADAIILNTDGLSTREVLERVVHLIHNRHRNDGNS